MKTRNLLPTLVAAGALPFLAVAQVANEAKSPTSSGDGGAQQVQPQGSNPAANPPREAMSTTTPATTTGTAEPRRTDPPGIHSPTSTADGGAPDPGTPQDQIDTRAADDKHDAARSENKKND